MLNSVTDATRGSKLAKILLTDLYYVWVGSADDIGQIKTMLQSFDLRPTNVTVETILDECRKIQTERARFDSGGQGVAERGRWSCREERLVLVVVGELEIFVYEALACSRCVKVRAYLDVLIL